MLHVAAVAGHDETIRALVAAGADPNPVDDTGRTPLHEAFAVEDPIEIVQLLVAAGADPNIDSTWYGWSFDAYLSRLPSRPRPVEETQRLFQILSDGGLDLERRAILREVSALRDYAITTAFPVDNDRFLVSGESLSSGRSFASIIDRDGSVDIVDIPVKQLVLSAAPVW